MIYFIKTSEAVKIGTSIDVDKRIKELQAASPKRKGNPKLFKRLENIKCEV